MRLAHLVELAPALRLETDRLVLRRFRADDADAALEQERDRRVMRWIRDAEPEPAMQERVARMRGPWQGGEGEWLTLLLAAKPVDAMLGLVACRVVAAANETMEIGYRLGADVHRRGYCQEACTALCDFLFREIGVRKLIAYCL